MCLRKGGDVLRKRGMCEKGIYVWKRGGIYV